MVKEWGDKKDSDDMKKDELNYYTQRQWDRVVGYGKVPKEYELVVDTETKIEYK